MQNNFPQLFVHPNEIENFEVIIGWSVESLSKGHVVCLHSFLSLYALFHSKFCLNIMHIMPQYVVWCRTFRLKWQVLSHCCSPEYFWPKYTLVFSTARLQTVCYKLLPNLVEAGLGIIMKLIYFSCISLVKLAFGYLTFKN